MFKFRRAKTRHAEDDDDDEPMTGKGQSSARSGVGNVGGSSSVPTPNQKMLGKQHQQTQQKKGLLGLRSRSAPRSAREQEGRQHRRRSASSQDDHDSTDTGTDAYTASDQEHSPLSQPPKGRASNVAAGHDAHDDSLDDDESSHDRTPPMKNGGDDDSDSSSYPSVGMNVVSSNAPSRAPPPRKNSQNGICRRGSRNSLQDRGAAQESGRRREVERAMGELNSTLSGIKRMQQQQQQQREGHRPRATKGKIPAQVSPSNANANQNANNVPSNSKHRRNQSASNVTTATHQTTGTSKTVQSEKTRGTTGTANTANTTNTGSSQKATENAAMQQLAMLVVSLRGDLEELKKEKEAVEEKLKDALHKNKKNPAPATATASTPAVPTTSNDENPFLQELKQENIELRADIDAFLLENDMLAKEVAELKEEKEATNDLIGRLKKEAGHNASSRSFHNSSATLDRHASNGVNGASSAVGMEMKNQQLSSKLQELTEENHKLEGELRLLVDEKQELMRLHSTAINDVSSKEKEVEELKGAVKEMADRLVAQNEEKEKDAESKEKAQEQAELVARLREDVADLTIVKEELKRELKDSSEYIAELERELEEKNKKAKSDVDRYANEIGEYEKGKVEYETELKQLREEKASLEEEKSKSESEVTRVRGELTRLEKQKEEFQKKSNDLDVTNVELTTKINDLVIQRSRTQKEFERLKETNAKLSDDLEKARAEASERASSCAAVAPAEYNDCSADTVLTLQRMISTLQASKERLEADLIKKDAEIQSEMEKVSQLEQKLIVQEEMAATNGEEESDLKIRIAGLLAENEEMKPRIAKLEGEKKMLEEELSKFRGELAEKEDSFDKLESSTRALQSEHTARVEQIYDLEETISSLQQTKDRLEADLQEASEAIALLEDELDRKDSATNEAMVQVIILRQQVSQVEKEKAALNKRNEELGERIDDLNTQIKVMIMEKTVASEEIESLQRANEEADKELHELVESSATLKEELTNQISKLQEELEESSDAIALLKEELGIMEQNATDNDTTIKNLEAALAEKDNSLQSIQMAKNQLQTEHQVNIDTISTLQKIIQSNEKNTEELELELNENAEKVADLRKELANSRPASLVTELEEKLAEVNDKNEVLMERVSELSDANEEMRKQIKDMLIESRARTVSDALVTRSCSVGADPRLLSADRAATCNTLISDLKKQIQDLLSERDAALEEVEVLKRESTDICHRPDDDEVITEAPEEDDEADVEEDVDDDMTYHTSAVETKPCEEAEDEVSIPATIESFKLKPTAPNSSQNSRGSSLLEQAKKICHELDEKRSKTPDAKRAEAEQEVKQPKRKPPCTESIKTVLDENVVSKILETVPDAMVHGEKHKNIKPANRSNSTSSEKKFDIDQLTSIYFEKCGTAASKLSDMTSDTSSSVYRRNRPDKNNAVTKKVKICRNGVFMGTYEGDLNAEGQRHGFGILICDNGNSYEGDWKKDKRDGLGIARYSSGDVYDGEWQRGKRQGHGVMYIEAGDTYIGSWHNGLKHGAGTYHWADGEVDVSWYQEDRRVGEGVRWNSSRNKAYRLIRGTRQEEISLDEAYKTAEKLGLNLAKVDSVSS